MSLSRYGKPTCASDEMNNQMVRGDWGWNGFFVSDCTALELMQVRKNEIPAGIDFFSIFNFL